jgi:hypothetical protein
LGRTIREFGLKSAEKKQEKLKKPPFYRGLNDIQKMSIFQKG